MLGIQFIPIRAAVFAAGILIMASLHAASFHKEKIPEAVELQRRIEALELLNQWVNVDQASADSKSRVHNLLNSDSNGQNLKRVSAAMSRALKALVPSTSAVADGMSRLVVSNSEEDRKKHDYLQKVIAEIQKSRDLYADDFLSWHQDALASIKKEDVGLRFHGPAGELADKLEADIRRLENEEGKRLSNLAKEALALEAKEKTPVAKKNDALTREYSAEEVARFKAEWAELEAKRAELESKLDELASVKVSTEKSELALREHVEDMKLFERTVALGIEETPLALRSPHRDPAHPTVLRTRNPAFPHQNETDYAEMTDRFALEERLSDLLQQTQSPEIDRAIVETRAEIQVWEANAQRKTPWNQALAKTWSLIAHRRSAKLPNLEGRTDLSTRSKEEHALESEVVRSQMRDRYAASRQERIDAVDGIGARAEQASIRRIALLDSIIPGYSYMEAQHNGYLAEIAALGYEIKVRSNDFEAHLERLHPMEPSRGEEKELWTALKEINRDIIMARFDSTDVVDDLKLKKDQLLQKIRDENVKQLNVVEAQKVSLLSTFDAHETKMLNMRLGLDTSTIQAKIGALNRERANLVEAEKPVEDIDLALNTLRGQLQHVQSRNPLAQRHLDTNPYLQRYQTSPKAAPPNRFKMIIGAAANGCEHVVKQAAQALFSF